MNIKTIWIDELHKGVN